MQKLKPVAAMGALSISLLANSAAYAHCGGCGHSPEKKDIVDTAVAAGGFETLIAVVKAAGLVETLKSDGPLTVFAPTDEAFGKLPKGTIEALLADPGRLGAILKYHVVPGRVMAEDVLKLSSAKSALGQSLAIKASSGVQVGQANVIKTDIETSNGVIHVIDTVLIPESDIIETARSAGSFKTLLAALEAADLTDALRGTGPLTVFAPTDEAFGKLPKGTVEALLTDSPKLQSILTYHVVAGKVMASDVVKLDEATTLQGQAVRIDAFNGVKINTARVVKADVAAANGVIHVIDEVLLPPSSKQGNAASPARKLIEHAINRGAPLYNDGHHAACAAIYEVAAMGLLASSNETLSDEARSTLNDALLAVQRSHDATKNAWTTRHALDAVYMSAADVTD